MVGDGGEVLRTVRRRGAHEGTEGARACRVRVHSAAVALPYHRAAGAAAAANGGGRQRVAVATRVSVAA